MPAMPEPSAKVIASIHGVRMPIAAAIRRFCVTARMRRPSDVRLSANSSPENTTSAKTMIQSRFQVTCIIPTLKAPDIQSGLPTCRFVGPKIVRTACCRISDTPKVASKVSSGRP